MLSIDIVKLAEDFDGWDNLWTDEGWVTPTNYDGPTVVDIWGSAFGSYQAEDSENWGHKDNYSYRQLTKNELKQLREILQTQRNKRHYKLVCRFIKWAIEYGRGELDFRFELYQQELYVSYFLGEDFNPVNDRLTDISNRIEVHGRMFFDNYYESMLPLYVQSLREIIKTQQVPLPC
jgi:hypothetical protein